MFMKKENPYSFFIFHFEQLYFFPYECPGPWYMLTQTRAFIRGKVKLLRSIWLDIFIERKPIFSEECNLMVNIGIGNIQIHINSCIPQITHAFNLKFYDELHLHDQDHDDRSLYQDHIKNDNRSTIMLALLIRGVPKFPVYWVCFHPFISINTSDQGVSVNSLVYYLPSPSPGSLVRQFRPATTKEIIDSVLTDTT